MTIIENREYLQSFLTKANIFSIVRFSINIVLWYVFTILSTIYSKEYLNLGYDAHTLTLVSFLYPAILKMLRLTSIHDLTSVFKTNNYLLLGLFNIGTILLTNIGMAETSVSLTYMVKVIFKEIIYFKIIRKINKNNN